MNFLEIFIAMLNIGIAIGIIQNSDDENITMIKKAIATRTKIILTPRRSHTIRGIPKKFNDQTLRIYIETDKTIETVLLKEIAHYTFPKELWDSDSTIETVDSPQTPQNNNNGESKESKITDTNHYSIDLDYWIKSNGYDTLTKPQLIDKINQLKNETLKQTWLKQIKGDANGNTT